MSNDVHALSKRLSLRAPQAKALRILHEIADLGVLARGLSRNHELAALQARYPGVSDFEREFAPAHRHCQVFR